MNRFSFIGLVVLFIFSGCAQKCDISYNEDPYNLKTHDDITVIENESRIISAKLFKDYLAFCSEKRIPVIFTSLVNIHNLTEISNFGRTFSELMMTNFAKHNVVVYDYRAKNAISVSEQGEFILSRDANKVRTTIGESYVFAGSYSVSEKAVIVNARLIDIRTGQVVTAASTTIKDKNVLKTVCQSGLCNAIKQDEEGHLIKVISEDFKGSVSCK